MKPAFFRACIASLTLTCFPSRITSVLGFIITRIITRVNNIMRIKVRINDKEIKQVLENGNHRSYNVGVR